MDESVHPREKDQSRTPDLLPGYNFVNKFYLMYQVPENEKHMSARCSGVIFCNNISQKVHIVLTVNITKLESRLESKLHHGTLNYLITLRMV